jgi:hypothetical protein
MPSGRRYGVGAVTDERGRLPRRAHRPAWGCRGETGQSCSPAHRSPDWYLAGVAFALYASWESLSVRRWVADSPDLPAAVNAVLTARAKALAKKHHDDAAVRPDDASGTSG